MTPIRERYARDGIVFPLPALTAAEVEAYRDAVEEHLRRDDAELRRLHLNYDWARDLATHPAVAAAAEELLGCRAVVWGTLVVRKDPRSDDYVAWHQDGAYAPFGGDASLSAWIALRESTIESGCMRALVGSHRARLPHRITADPHNLLSRRQEVAGDIETSRLVHVVLQPGEMSLHHFDLVHGSAPNRSAAPRTAFIVRYLRRGTPWKEWPLIDARRGR